VAARLAPNARAPPALPAPDRVTRPLALWLTFATGVSGLVYQVTWERYLATLLGSHGEATAAVLGLFLGGLACGYALFGHLTRRRFAAAAADGTSPRLLALYGAVEAGIGAWALFFPLLFSGVRAISVRLPELPPGPAFVIDVALSALLLLPPTVLMGGTIPILTQGLARSTADATRVHARVYGINTAGAVLGALLAGFWWIAALGFPGTLRAMALVNLAVGACFWRAGDLAGAVPPSPADAASEARVPGLLPYLAAALLSGFAMMTLEIIAIRIGGLSLGSSEYAFSVVVAVFVGCIAAGSLIVGALPRIPSGLLLGSQLALVAVLLALYPHVPLAPYGAHRLRLAFTTVDLAFYGYFLLVFGAAALCIAPAVLLSGATLPLIFDHLRRRYGDLGSAAGQLYSWNTVGSLLGALVGGYALLLWLDLYQVYRIATAALVLGGILLALAELRQNRRRPWVAAVGLAFPLLGLRLLGLPEWPPEDLASGLYRAREPIRGEEDGPGALRARLFDQKEIVFYEDDPGASVAVLEFEAEPGTIARGLVVNGKPDSATYRDLTTTIFLGVLPAMLADSPKRAFVAGLGTGVTSGELAELDGIEEVVVAEISPGVAHAAPLFDFASHDASRNPRVRLARSDAYRALQRSRGSYDLIVSEPSNPWVTGVELLYSREFLAAARSRLAPGGVYCQWMHQYETDDASLALVLRTFSDVFDHVSIWYGLGNDLLILGFPEAREPETLLARIRERAVRPDFAAALQRAEIPGLAGLLAHELVPLGVTHRAGLPGPLHRIEHPLLSHLAARAFFRGDSGSLPFMGFGDAARVGRDTALWPRYPASQPASEQNALWEAATREACRRRGDVCVAFLAAWSVRADGAPAFSKTLKDMLAVRPEFGARISLSLVSDAVHLMSDDGAEDAVSLAQARRASAIYRTYYQAAAPFEAERLLALWKRCREPADACQQGAAQAARLLERGDGSDAR
jgi:spermidine synthase